MDDGVAGSSGALEDPLTSISLRDYRDEGGLRHLGATRTPDGGILIEGQDLGPGVERAFGAGLTEYEWAWAVPPDAVPAAVAALDGHEGDDPLRLLAAWAAAHDDSDPGSHLREAGVSIEFWSRVGD
jgi:hypothetical protein